LYCRSQRFRAGPPDITKRTIVGAPNRATVFTPFGLNDDRRQRLEFLALAAARAANELDLGRQVGHVRRTPRQIFDHGCVPFARAWIAPLRVVRAGSSRHSDCDPAGTQSYCWM
jgi:hypothetical protein